MLKDSRIMSLIPWEKIMWFKYFIVLLGFKWKKIGKYFNMQELKEYNSHESFLKKLLEKELQPVKWWMEKQFFKPEIKR